MKYYKVKTGFNLEDNISITHDELEKAIYAHMTGKVVVFKNGTVRGTNIISIKEDWHKAMGWNAGYELQPEDFEEINQKCKDYNGLFALAKENVEECLRQNRPDLIGRNILSLPEFTKSDPNLPQIYPK